MAKVGRPVEPVPAAKADEIIAWISDGKTLREFCRQEGNPSPATVYAWIDKDQEFARRFARARELGEDAIAQECLAIADDASNDWETRKNKKGEEYIAPNPEMVLRSRLRVETRLKLLAKWNPKKYGDRLDVNGEMITKVVLPSNPQADHPALPAPSQPAFDEASDDHSHE
jgi:hypothetical protein